jgi:hypothetical protein
MSYCIVNLSERFPEADRPELGGRITEGNDQTAIGGSTGTPFSDTLPKLECYPFIIDLPRLTALIDYGAS